MSSISIKKAAMINAVAKYSTVITSLVFTAILARVLTPQDYGIVALVYVFSTFFAILSDMGLGTAVIQKKELSETDISNIFGLSFRISIFLALVFCALSAPISMLYGNKAYILICCILSLSIFFNTLNVIPNALLLKEKRFKTVGVRMVTVNIITGILTVIAAIWGAKYYALIFQSVSLSFVTFIWNYWSTKPKMALKYDRAIINKIKTYSGYQFGFNLANYFSRNLDNLLIGKFIGTSQLAFYNQAYTLMLYPLNYLTYILASVMHPILSDYQTEKEHIYLQYISVAKILSLCGAFFSAFCYSTSREIILIIYGDQWVNSITCFQILALSIFFQMSSASAGSIYLSIGDTKTMFKSGIVFTSVMAAGIILGVLSGDINKIAMYVVVGLIIRFFIDYYFLIRLCFGYSALEFYKKFIPDFGILIAMLISMTVANNFAINNLFFSAFYKFIVCSLVFLVLLIITKQYKYFMVFLP